MLPREKKSSAVKIEAREGQHKDPSVSPPTWSDSNVNHLAKNKNILGTVLNRDLKLIRTNKSSS